MPKLTKRFVDTLQADPDGHDVSHWDAAMPGFGVRVKPSGTTSWVVQYRNAQGRVRKVTFGRVGVLTPDEARTQARRLLASVDAGSDPSAERRKARQALTVAELCDDYLECEKGRIKHSTLFVDKSRIERHVKPLIGTRSINSVTHSDIEKFLRDVAAGKSAEKKDGRKGTQDRKRGGVTTGGWAVASRTVGMLGTIFERAVRDGAISANPVRGVKRPKDKARKPPFSFDAVRELGKALIAAEREGENANGLLAIRLLLLTGCRRMEILTLRHGAIDVAARCFRFDDTKSGPQVRPIGQAALGLLKGSKSDDAERFVLPGESKAGHFVGLPRVWARVAARANLNGVSIHGLRHWYASAAAELNFSELTIAGLLGHRVKGVTARYATTPDSALLAAADKVSTRLVDVLEGKDAKTTVVDLKRGKQA